MKITQREIVERQTALHIELEEEDLEPYVERGYRQVVSRIRIPGFRKGKAPRTIVENAVGREGMLSEVLEFMVTDVLDKAIDSQNIEAAGIPEVENVELDPVQIEAKVALSPILDLGDYRGIQVEEEPVEVNDEDVQKQLEDLQKFNGSWEPADRAVKFDDLITMNVRGSQEGNELVNETDSQYIVDPEATNPFPGFSSSLEGLEIEQPSEFDVTLDNEYSDSELAGKTIHFEVVVKEVKERVLPDLDDEFAKTVADEYQTLDDLKVKVRENIALEASRARDQEYRERVLDELVLTADIELAPILVEREMGHLKEHRDELVQRMQITLEDYYRYTGRSEDEIDEEMHEQAVNSLSRSYAIATLAESEGIEVEEGELQERLKELAREGENGRKLTSKELRSERVKNSIRESLVVQKAVDWLVEAAKTKPNDSTEETTDEEIDPGKEGDKNDG